MSSETKMTCIKCNKKFDHLGHVRFNKTICNKCCETSVYDSKGLFTGCNCVGGNND